MTTSAGRTHAFKPFGTCCLQQRNGFSFTTSQKAACPFLHHDSICQGEADSFSTSPQKINSVLDCSAHSTKRARVSCFTGCGWLYTLAALSHPAACTSVKATQHQTSTVAASSFEASPSPDACSSAEASSAGVPSAEACVSSARARPLTEIISLTAHSVPPST